MYAFSVAQRYKFVNELTRSCRTALRVCYNGFHMSFGERLSRERKRNGLTAEALAQACGISRSYITLIEQDKRQPGVKVIPRLAGALHLKTNIVLNWYLEDMRQRLEKTLNVA